MTQKLPPSRRRFIGGSAAAVLATAGAGIGAFGMQQGRAPQGRSSGLTNAVADEVHQQIRLAMPKLLEANGNAARQIATALRIYAASLADSGALIRQAVQQTGRTAILSASFDHADLEQRAQELNFPVSQLPPHSDIDPIRREKALDMLVKEGLAPLMRRVADGLDESADAWARAGTVQTVALQEPAPSCCGWACDLVPEAEAAMTIACALCVLFPVTCELCAGASATYLTVFAACMACRLLAIGC